MISEKNFKFSFDLGTNSIGWAVFEVTKEGDPFDIVKSGVRIFSDGRIPKTGESLAVERRIARGGRRRRDRFLKRKQRLMSELVSTGLMPEDVNDRIKLKHLDVYFLRDRATRGKVSKFEIGRILYHLNQRRGFKSNRKEMLKEETSVNKVKILELKKTLDLYKVNTLGQFLYQQHQERKRLRFTGESNFYPDRSFYEEEFDAIYRKQKEYYPEILDEDWLNLKNIIFYQRPLKSQKNNIGKCQVFTNEIRAPKASLYFQRFRLLQDLANLKMIEPDGTSKDIDREDKLKLYNKLIYKKEMSFDQIRKELKSPNITFNIESGKSKKIQGDLVSKNLKDVLGEDLSRFSFDDLDEIVTLLVSDLDDKDVASSLQDMGIDSSFFESLFSIKFPEGHGQLSKKALEIIVPEMEKNFCSPEQLIRGILGTPLKTSLNKALKYYGEILPSSVVGADETKNPETDKIAHFGKISNPTVHICLNQLRKVTNNLINEFGAPAAISVEVTRDLKNSKKKRLEIEKIQSINQKDNDRIREILLTTFNIKSPSREDVVKYKLWEELGGGDVLDRKCPYSLTHISATMLFGPEVEIEHILPFSKTLDDSISNKTICLRSSNQKKGNRTPFEAFGNENNWEEIRSNAQKKFGSNKFWRFLPDAMDRFGQDDNFIARQLNDTAYISKISKKYLESICSNVNVIPGKLTALVRHQLGLNTVLGDSGVKNRNNHKHHAVDAVVIGIISRSFLLKVSRLSENERSKIVINGPFENFREKVKESIDNIIVSRKEDRGTQGKLHEETYYGIISENASYYEKEHQFNLVSRKNLNDFKEKDISLIRSLEFREIMLKEGLDSGREVLKNLGVKKLRVLKKDKSIRNISHPLPKPIYYKGVIPGDNHSLEVWKVPTHISKVTGIKIEEHLSFEVYNYFERAEGTSKKPHPAAKLLFKIHKGDNVYIKVNDKLLLMNVKTIRPSNKLIGIVPIDSSTRSDNETLWPTFSSFKSKELRLVKIDPTGKIIDPGNPYV